MRTSEWIQIGFAVALAAAAWIQAWVAPRPLSLRKRGWITLLGVIPLIAVALARGSAFFLPRWYVSVLRDWLTVGLFLVPYWQTGLFFQGPDHRIEQKLMAFDRWLLPGAAATSGTARTGLGWVLEIAYLFCYPFVPLGLLALYVVGQRYHAGGFWLVVLIATYVCYVITPFVPAYPPRDLAGGKPVRAQVGKARVFNRWILQHGSIHAISFPQRTCGVFVRSLAGAAVLHTGDGWGFSVYCGVDFAGCSGGTVPLCAGCGGGGGNGFGGVCGLLFVFVATPFKMAKGERWGCPISRRLLARCGKRNECMERNP